MQDCIWFTRIQFICVMNCTSHSVCRLVHTSPNNSGANGNSQYSNSVITHTILMHKFKYIIMMQLFLKSCSIIYLMMMQEKPFNVSCGLTSQKLVIYCIFLIHYLTQCHELMTQLPLQYHLLIIHFLSCCTCPIQQIFPFFWSFDKTNTCAHNVGFQQLKHCSYAV